MPLLHLVQWWFFYHHNPHTSGLQVDQHLSGSLFTAHSPPPPRSCIQPEAIVSSLSGDLLTSKDLHFMFAIPSWSMPWILSTSSRPASQWHHYFYIYLSSHQIYSSSSSAVSLFPNLLFSKLINNFCFFAMFSLSVSISS